MDIAALSTNLSQANLLASSQMAVANIALETAKQNAQMTNELIASGMENQLKPHLGSNIDVKV